MKKTFKLAVFIFALISALTIFSSCSGSASGGADDLVFKTSDGKEISLYMQRDEVEEILGKGEEPQSGMATAQYDGFSLGYTEGLLSLINIESDGIKTKSGLTVGASADKAKSLSSYDDNYMFAYYSYDEDENKYTLLEGESMENSKKIQDELNKHREIKDKIKKYASISCQLDSDKNIRRILISDYYTGLYYYVDKY